MKGPLLSLACLGMAVVCSSQTSRSRPGEILVKFKPGTAITQSAFQFHYNASVLETLPTIGVTVLKLPDGFSEEQAINDLKSLKSAVEFAEKNVVYDYDAQPNDPHTGFQYHLQMVRAPEAWTITMGSASVIIAIVDSGVMLTHEDLAPKVLAGKDFYNEDNDPTDDVGHGTFCAGLAAAATNNRKGIAGVGFNCRILPIKVGGPGGVPSSDAAEGITWAADHGANVINLSFGGPSPNQTMKAAIDYAVNVKNVLVVAAAGNQNFPIPIYPAGFPNVLSVGATDSSDQKAFFSNYGSWVSVAAPGLDVYSTALNGSYTFGSGTSFSAPIVSGVAGLVWSEAGPTATNAEIRKYIEDSTDNVGSWLSHGRVNAMNAIAAIVRITPVAYDATTIQIDTGQYLSGNLASLPSLDGATFNIHAIKVPFLGVVSSLQSDFSVADDPNDMNSLSVLLNASGPSKATQFVYAWNWQTSQYELLKSFPLTTNPATREVFLQRPFSPFIQPGTNTVRILARAIGPQKYLKQMDYSIDRLRMKAMVRDR